jgi:putative oxidoreductase
MVPLQFTRSAGPFPLAVEIAMWDTITHRWVIPLLLRLGLAAIFLYHGLDLVGNHAWGTAWNDKLPVVAQVAVAWGELLGGLAMLLGLLTRPAAVGLAIIMIGAIATVHWPHGFDIRHGGWEYNFAILILCAGAFLLGGGQLAVDRLFVLRRRT